MGMGPGSKAAQPGAHGCAKSVRVVGSLVSARLGSGSLGLVAGVDGAPI